jgi:hypothetical protein
MATSIVVSLYEPYELDAVKWPQARYHVSAYDDVLWTNDPAEVLKYVAEELVAANKRDIEADYQALGVDRP